MIKTDYMRHDDVYQRKRNKPEYAGWNKHEEVARNWEMTWMPLMQKETFLSQGRLLELGCGAGNLSVAFAKLGYEVTGVDIAPAAIDWAIKNAEAGNIDVNFLQGDVLNLVDFAEASFDIALDGYCLHCIVGRDRAHFLQSARRILKVGGIFVTCTMCNQVPDTKYFRECFDPKSCCMMHGDIAVRYIGDSNDILQEIMLAGFKLLEVQVVPPTYEEDLADLRVIAEKI